MTWPNAKVCLCCNGQLIMLVGHRRLEETGQRRLPGIPVEGIGGLLEGLPVEQALNVA